MRLPGHRDSQPKLLTCWGAACSMLAMITLDWTSCKVHQQALGMQLKRTWLAGACGGSFGEVRSFMPKAVDSDHAQTNDMPDRVR